GPDGGRADPRRAAVGHAASLSSDPDPGRGRQDFDLGFSCAGRHAGGFLRKIRKGLCSHRSLRAARSAGARAGSAAPHRSGGVSHFSEGVCMRHTKKAHSGGRARIAAWLGAVLLAMGAPCGPAQAQTSTYPSEAGTLEVTTLHKGLENPWALAFLPQGEGLLITERPGRLRLWTPDGGMSSAIEGLPEVFAKGQGGLLDVALPPDFAQTRRVYLSYAEGSRRNPGE